LCRFIGWILPTTSISDHKNNYYSLEVARWGTENWQEVFRGQTNITNGTLGTFDPSGLENDSYQVRLSAFDLTGRGTVVQEQLDVTGELKLGNFKLSFTDISIPVNGIPINLTRTYDSLTAGTTDDFGYGWRMEFRDTDLRTSLKPDPVYEQLGYRTEGFQDGTRIYITLPGGKREAFTFQPRYVGGLLAVTGWMYPNFVADKGVTSTLTVPGAVVSVNSVSGDVSGNVNGLLRRNRQGKLYTAGGQPYVPQDEGFGNRYLLTTKDGTVYEINATSGDLESVTDTNGNKLTYTDYEISSSTGQKVTFERDASGRITSVTDPLGAKVVYAYDAKGDLVSVTDRDGNTTQFGYNSSRAHYLEKIVDPLGREAVKTEYDEQGRLKKTSNASGNGVEFVYDPANAIEIVKDALGNPTTYEYDKRGNVVRAVDAMGGTTRMEYDDDNRVTKTTDANNLVTKYTYDAAGNLTSRSETYCGCAGVVPGSTTYTYNSLGQQTSITLPTGATVFQDYDSRGNLLALRDGKGSQILSYTYDDNGNVLSETSDGTTTTYKYDSRGNVIETKDADGTITKTEYDANNRLSKMIEADGSVSLFTYDKEGRQTKADYGNGLFVNYTYTATSPDWTVIEGPTIGRIERKFTTDGKLGGWVTPEGEITFTYDAAGRLWKETQPNGQTTEYVYDAAGRVTKIKDLSTGKSIDKSYNTGGQVLSETDAFGRTTSFTYDKNGKVASTTNALGQTYSYVYAGSSTTIIDPLGRKTTSTNNDYYLPSSTTYDNGAKTSVEYLYTNNLLEATDYPTKVIGLNGKVRTYGYDAQGNLTSTSDLAGNLYTYDYGTNGVSSITSPTGAQINYEYDTNGNLTKLSYGAQIARRLSLRSLVAGSPSLTAAASPTAPPAKAYTYDKDDRLESITNASGSKIEYTYDTRYNVITQTATDASGNVSTIGAVYGTDDELSSVTNSTGTTSYQYDADGYVSQITGANGSIISYVYDGQGNIIKQTEKANASATGIVTEYGYDIYGKLLSVKDSRSRTTTMTYDSVNRLETKTLPNGVKTTYGYDTFDWVISIVHTKADGTVLASQTYTRNLGGEPSKVVREDGSYTEYKYDPAVRLSKEVAYNASGVAVRSIEYSYDLDGKRTRKVDYLGTHDYTYNAQGQLESIDSDSYAYDADGRLTTVTKTGQTLNLVHDTFDRLTQVTNNGTTTQYLYDANGNRVREIGSATKNYLVVPNLQNGLESTDLVTDGSGTVVSDYVYGGSEVIARLDAAGNPVYYLTDDMGSVIGLVDASGNLVSRIIYDGFGNVVSGDDGSSLGGDLRFQGQWLEGESGLYYMRARNYDAQTGLFLSRDAVDVLDQSVEAFSSYQFAYNNPLVYSDPTGLITLNEVQIAQIIDEILESIQRKAISDGKEFLIDQAKGVVGKILNQFLGGILPTELSNIDSPNSTRTPGDLLEALVTKGVCDILRPQGLGEKVWQRAEVSVGGKPGTNGVNCGKKLPSDDYFEVLRSQLPARKGKKPDFILSEIAPLEVAKNKGKSWLIGDFKIKPGSIVYGMNQNKKQFTQWLAINRYAAKYTYARIATYITFYNDSTRIEVLKKEALKEFKVLLFVIPLIKENK
jgi:RHS repeat-associated protein